MLAIFDTCYMVDFFVDLFDKKKWDHKQQIKFVILWYIVLDKIHFGITVVIFLGISSHFIVIV